MLPSPCGGNVLLCARSARPARGPGPARRRSGTCRFSFFRSGLLPGGRCTRPWGRPGAGAGSCVRAGVGEAGAAAGWTPPPRVLPVWPASRRALSSVSVSAFETPLRLQGPARPCWSPPQWATWGLSLWPPMAGGRPRAAPSRRRYVPGRARAGHGFDFDASACPPSRRPPPNHRDPPVPSPGSATSDARRCCVISALRVTWSGCSDVGASVRPAPWPAVTPPSVLTCSPRSAQSPQPFGCDSSLSNFLPIRPYLWLWFSRANTAVTCGHSLLPGASGRARARCREARLVPPHLFASLACRVPFPLAGVRNQSHSREVTPGGGGSLTARWAQLCTPRPGEPTQTATWRGLCAWGTVPHREVGGPRSVASRPVGSAWSGEARARAAQTDRDPCRARPPRVLPQVLGDGTGFGANARPLPSSGDTASAPGPELSPCTDGPAAPGCASKNVLRSDFPPAHPLAPEPHSLTEWRSLGRTGSPRDLHASGADPRLPRQVPG